MRALRVLLVIVVAVATLAAIAFFGARALTRGSVSVADGAGSVEHGGYVFAAAGCLGCHTDTAEGAAPLAGGRALATPFGTFYGPNLTPDPEHGIGGWSLEQFAGALRQGVAAHGADLYPVFPYTSFTRMTDEDIRDLYAYLMAQPPVAQPSRRHDVAFPFNIRAAMTGWKLLFLDQGPEPPDPALSAVAQRGAYLVRALGHCGECHTSRNAFGATDETLFLAGNPTGPDGKPVPNITPDADTGIGRWSESEITALLQIGMTPDGDFVGGGMREVVTNSTSRLTAEDRAAIAAYLKAIPAIASQAGVGAAAPAADGSGEGNAWD